MKKVLQLLLADDDEDERLFFAKALQAAHIPTNLVTVENGEELIDYLKTSEPLPDALFLDINMPRKNGSESLREIKADKSIKEFPVIIYSTCLTEKMIDVLYKEGAYYYLRKGDFSDLVRSLQSTLVLLQEKKLKQPPREKFVLNTQEKHI